MKRTAFSVFVLWAWVTVAHAATTATLSSHEGDLKILRRFKSITPAAGLELEPKDMLITGENGRAELVLADESVVNLGPETRFKLAKVKVPDANTREVILDVIEGAGMFDVNGMNENNTFVVRTPVAVAGVRGTRFSVKHRRSRRGRYRSSVSVLKGQVFVRPARRSSARPAKAVILPPLTKSDVSSGTGASAPKAMSRQEVESVAMETGFVAPSAPGGSGGGRAAVPQQMEQLFQSLGIDPQKSGSLAPKVGQKLIQKRPLMDPAKLREQVQDIQIKIQDINNVIQNRVNRISAPPSPPTNPN